ncbi:MAG: GNAT family N-acetyltransferase [Maribacter sp.]|nr:GNAT family N-acetyltransferase [Maribacter sp.]
MELLLQGQETERLLFRKLRNIDFDAWLPFHQNPLSTQFWEGLPQNPKISCQEWFARVFYRYENQLGGMKALIEKKSSKLIGQCGLLIQEVDEKRELEIGYSILPSYWGNGFATEAAQKCKTFAFENQFAESLISIVHIDNIASKKVAWKLGMEIERQTIYKDNPVYIFRTNHA